jgi:hypothetical protein
VYIRIIPALALALIAPSCSHTPKTTAPKPSPGRSSAAPRSWYADLGPFVAGLPARAGGPFAELEKQPAWAKHRGELDRAWSRFEANSLPAMRAFQQRELCAAPISTAPVFYPFSGPDALMVIVLFPKNPCT